MDDMNEPQEKPINDWLIFYSVAPPNKANEPYSDDCPSYPPFSFPLRYVYIIMIPPIAYNTLFLFYDKSDSEAGVTW